jgi:hypothetical protein
MIKKTLIVIILLNIGNLVIAQEARFTAPDYKAIKKITTDKKSSGYYPLLMERFNNSDTGLTLMDFRNLYYGLLFTDKYTPYPTSKYIDSCNQFLRKDSLTQEEYRQLMKYETLFLEDSPFGIRNLNILAYCCAKTGDTVSANKNIFKMKRIIEAILSTGDGRTEETAFHVISVSHEYDILEVLGLEFGGKQTLTTKGCDYLEVLENEHNIKGFYFNVQKMLEKERKLFK